MNKKIECHDCGAELVIKDKHNEIELDNLSFCPLCGSDNIEVTETK